MGTASPSCLHSSLILSAASSSALAWAMVSASADGSPGEHLLNDAASQLVAWGVMPVGFIIVLMELLKLPKQALVPLASCDDIFL